MNFKTFKLAAEEDKRYDSQGNFLGVKDEKPQQFRNIEDSTPQDLFLDSFMACIIGKPGQGKSTLIPKLLKDQNALRDKFDILLICSPTRIPGIPYNPEYWSPDLSIEWIVSRLNYHRDRLDGVNKRKPNSQQAERAKRKKRLELQVALRHININELGEEELDILYDKCQDIIEIPGQKNKMEVEDDPYHVLTDNNNTKYKAVVVIDDLIRTIRDSKTASELEKLFFNRRGRVFDVSISFIITAQTWKAMPVQYRNMLEWVCLFAIGKEELEQICKERMANWKGKILRMVEHFRTKHNFVYLRFNDNLFVLNTEQII